MSLVGLAMIFVRKCIAVLLIMPVKLALAPALFFVRTLRIVVYALAILAAVVIILYIFGASLT